MFTYRVTVTALLDAEAMREITTRIDFEPGVTSVIPAVDEELCFNADRRTYSMTIDKRCFSYFTLSAHTVIEIDLMGRAVEVCEA